MNIFTSSTSKNFFFLLSFLFLTFFADAQVIFEEGFYIDKQGVKVNGYIKNEGWLNNPDKFEFRETPTSETRVLSSEEVEVFVIPETSKYISARVGIDRTSGKLTSLNEDRNPKLEEETLFLKVLLEGEATLYFYMDGEVKRYFFSVADSKVEPLIFKKFLMGNKIARNNYFRQQLFNALSCDNMGADSFGNLSYTKNELLRVFQDYNSCIGSATNDYRITSQKEFFEMAVKAGAGYMSLDFDHKGDIKNVTLKGSMAFMLGLELQYTFPFLRNKWSVFGEPTFFMYKTEGDLRLDRMSNVPSIPGVREEVLPVNVDYSTLTLPLGFRHHIFLGETTETFLNVGLGYDLVFDSVEITDGAEIKADFPNGLTYFFGAGYILNKRITAELRYTFGNSENDLWMVKHNRLSIALGYKI